MATRRTSLGQLVRGTSSLSRADHRPPSLARALALSLSLLACVSASGSSVLQVSFDELVVGANLIVEGRVLQVEARQDPHTPFIWTHVTLDVSEVLHGSLESDRIELRFLGGTAGGRTLRVTDMAVPEPGEQGIYFIENASRLQVHPLLGWQQGHFRVEAGPDGVERVRATGRRTVAGITSVPIPSPRDLSSGIAAGIQTLSREAGTDAGMRPDEFKAAIRDVLSRHGALAR